MALDNGKNDVRRPRAASEPVPDFQGKDHQKRENSNEGKAQQTGGALQRRAPHKPSPSVNDGSQPVGRQRRVELPRVERSSGEGAVRASKAVGSAAPDDVEFLPNSVDVGSRLQRMQAAASAEKGGRDRRKSSSLDSAPWGSRYGGAYAGRDDGSTPDLMWQGASGKRGANKTSKSTRHESVRRLNSPESSDREIENERRRQSKKRKARRNRIILMAVIETLTLVLIFCSGVIVRYMGMTQEVTFDVAKVKNTNIDIKKQQTMQGYWTVAVFGVDSRDGGVGKGANADVQIIANVDMGTGDINLVSVYRDSYLSVNTKGRYAKINEAYATGGPEQAVSALNRNLDLDIENYVTFNWKAVADAVSMIGGVDIDVTSKEFYYMNAYIHETCIKSGINPLNPAAEYIQGPGYQHLDGVQAVAYARLRYMDSDFERTRRQREIISQVLEKAKKTDLATLTSIIDAVLPQVALNIDVGDIIQLARTIARFNLKETTGFPFDLKDQMMGKKGDCVIPVTLASNVTKLHEFLYGDEDYDPSGAVWTYSKKISDDSGNYKLQAQESRAALTAPATEAETEREKEKETEKERESGDEDRESDREDKTETDEDGNAVKDRKREQRETDEDGFVIRSFDEDGEPVYETNSSGEKVKYGPDSMTGEREGRTGDESEETDEDESSRNRDRDGDEDEDEDDEDRERRTTDSDSDVETDPSGNPIRTSASAERDSDDVISGNTRPGQDSSGERDEDGERRPGQSDDSPGGQSSGQNAGEADVYHGPGTEEADYAEAGGNSHSPGSDDDGGSPSSGGNSGGDSPAPGSDTGGSSDSPGSVQETAAPATEAPVVPAMPAAEEPAAVDSPGGPGGPGWDSGEAVSGGPGEGMN